MTNRSKSVIVLGLLAGVVAIALLSLIFKRDDRGKPFKPLAARTTNVSATPVPTQSGAPPVGNSAGLVDVTFDSPQENDSVPRTFQVSGHCGPMPSGQHLLLVIRTGSVFSPKWPPCRRARQYLERSCDGVRSSFWRSLHALSLSSGRWRRGGNFPLGRRRGEDATLASLPRGTWRNPS
jgi:hypothetical protein